MLSKSPMNFLSAHDAYLALGKCDNSRQRSYRDMFKSELNVTVIDQVRTATNSTYALGSEKFKTEIEEALRRRIGLGKPGRPRSWVG